MIIKITPNKEKVKSMLKLIENREKFISSINIDEFSTIASENYYEIIKELSIALLSLHGIKTAGENAHKEIIECLKNYEDFPEEEIALLDDLRMKRNKSSYEGKQIDKSYIEEKKDKLMKIIEKLKKLIEEGIK